jgi:hypothetical protein
MVGITVKSIRFRDLSTVFVVVVSSKGQGSRSKGYTHCAGKNKKTRAQLEETQEDKDRTKAKRHDEAIQKTRQKQGKDQTKQENARQHKTRQHNTRQHQTTQDKQTQDITQTDNESKITWLVGRPSDVRLHFALCLVVSF